MFGSIGNFAKDRKGAFAMQFALLAIPLVACTGLAIDGGRAFLARYELAAACDAAALAIASTVDESADINVIAHKFVNANFHGEHVGEIALEVEDVGDEDETVILRGNVTIPTYFMPVVGQPTASVGAECEVKRGGNDVEVSLVLDITGSMSGTRIADLRTAASDLVDTVVGDVQTPYYSKVAVIPYSNAVNAGDYADEARGALEPGHSITAAGWRDGLSKTVTNAHWRNGSAKTISTASWRYGSARTVSAITKLTGPDRIRVTTSSNHGYTTGQFVRITGANGSYTGLNNNIYVVEVASSTRYYLRDLTNTAYITPPAGSTNSTAGSSQRCFSATCEVGVTTSASHGLSNGDFVYISGVSGMTAINNSSGTSWTIDGASGSIFVLPGTDGPGSALYNTDGSGGSASECYNDSCQVQISAASHGFSTGDFVRISGVSGATWVNNSTGESWVVDGTSTNSFFLANTSPSTGSASYTSGGSASECYVAACEIRVTTSDAHGIADGERVKITGVGGMSINNTGNASWAVDVLSATTLALSGTDGPSYSAYTSGGTLYCLTQGCQYYRFNNANDGSVRIHQATTCVSERTGAQAYTDEDPASSPVGLSYPPSSGNTCPTSEIVPLSSDKTDLKAKIAALPAAGSTAGQIGIAWGWYMLSPEWASLFPSASQPAAYGAPHLAKVAVLMTDGEFNTPYCNGVIAANATSGSGSSSDHINCNATNGNPYDQAAALCAGMKADGVIVYTVGFDISSSTDVTDLLYGCATDASHVYLPSTGSDLKEAFKDIAHSIAQLRLSR